MTGFWTLSHSRRFLKTSSSERMVGMSLVLMVLSPFTSVSIYVRMGLPSIEMVMDSTTWCSGHKMDNIV